MADSFHSVSPPIMSGSLSFSGAVDDTHEDACSICLEPFGSQEPPTLVQVEEQSINAVTFGFILFQITTCRHEYHLQCILEWSQRSKECPICWQLLALKDPASQELLAAVESERRARSRQISAISSSFNQPTEVFEAEHDAPYTVDSDFNERIMQHLAAAANRARYISRRGRRAAGLGPSPVLVFASPEQMHNMSQLPHGFQISDNGSSDGDSPNSSISSTISDEPPSVVAFAENSTSNATSNGGSPPKPRSFFSSPRSVSPPRSSTSEFASLSESFRSKFSAASARYKESVSKSTQSLKEKLLARNNSVKELSKGVQREMSQGIAGVARLFERLDLSTKRTEVPVPPGPTSIFSKGKAVQDFLIPESESPTGNNAKIADVAPATTTSITGSANADELLVSEDVKAFGASDVLMENRSLPRGVGKRCGFGLNSTCTGGSLGRLISPLPKHGFAPFLVPLPSAFWDSHVNQWGGLCLIARVLARKMVAEGLDMEQSLIKVYTIYLCLGFRSIMKEGL
ncbi:Zinc finger, RING-H2-type [Dillenia turbinata]|uniref:RING-type E3 ubiquitin transferase n=1 Tax=Dillenia turbinata TaxID=194707 RepID=A0AAN8V9F8_9MAGN